MSDDDITELCRAGKVESRPRQCSEVTMNQREHILGSLPTP